LHRLGVIDFARYGRAADLGNGRWFYPMLAIGGESTRAPSRPVCSLFVRAPSLHLRSFCRDGMRDRFARIAVTLTWRHSPAIDASMQIAGHRTPEPG
jgi:hypothetical protein